MEWVALVTVLALIEYFVFGMLVGRARVAHGVKAPATTGHPLFERYNRVHQNTAEQLWVFLPSLWLFARYLHAPTAALLGLVWIVGRVLYLRGYVADPEKRTLGFAIGALASLALLLGSLVGVVRALVA